MKAGKLLCSSGRLLNVPCRRSCYVWHVKSVVFIVVVLYNMQLNLASVLL